MSNRSNSPHEPSRPRRIALIGNPNTGKSTLFGRLAGARVHTANFPGTTQEAHLTRMNGLELIDLPGLYSLAGDEPEAALCRSVIAGHVPGEVEHHPPDAVCVVVDASNLERNLRLVGEIARVGLPMLVVLNCMDRLEARNLSLDMNALTEALGCELLATVATEGRGVDQIRPAFERARRPATPPLDQSLREWAGELASRTARTDHAPGRTPPPPDRLTDRLDDLFTHPVLGSLFFAFVMTGLFWVVFKLATYPMDWIDAATAALGDSVASVLPEGAVRSLLVEGVIGGVGATVIFLPQICLMFFLITLLEHSGYLPRAALLVDRLFRPFGLPGHAFVPLLSAHACAIPGIIACRGIRDPKERLAAILVAPFMSCSARIPVYVLLTSLLFSDRPALAALAFTGCYVLGASTALATALLLRRSILRSDARPMALELSPYRRPSVRLALITVWDRATLFLRKAGTVILAMMIALWWLGAYPLVDPPAESTRLREQAAGSGDAAERDALLEQAELLEARHAKASSFMGMIGRGVAPVFTPLGYDWQLTVGIVSSFAAREVFVSTMAVVLAAGEEDAEPATVLERIGGATRDDGTTPVFTRRVAWSLLVFYVLAMQCLPTLAVTAREAGGWKWAGLQFVWMTTLAYLGALAASLLFSALG